MSQAQRRKAESLSRPELVELARYCGLRGADNDFRTPYRNREWICANLPASIFGSSRSKKTRSKNQRGGDDPVIGLEQQEAPVFPGSGASAESLAEFKRKKLLYCKGPPLTLPVELNEDDPDYDEIYRALYPEGPPEIPKELEAPEVPPELPGPPGKGKKATEAVITSGGIGTSGGLAGFAEAVAEKARKEAVKIEAVPETPGLIPPTKPLPLGEGGKKTLAAMREFKPTPPSEIGEAQPELPGLIPLRPGEEPVTPSEYGPGPSLIPSEYGPLPPLEPEVVIPGVVPPEGAEVPAGPPEGAEEAERVEVPKKKRAKKKCPTECPDGFTMNEAGLCLEVMKTCPAVEDCKTELQSLGLKEAEARTLLDGVKEKLVACEFSSKGWKQTESDLKDLRLTKEQADRILNSVGRHLVARMDAGEKLDTLLDTIQKTLDQTSAIVAALPPALQTEFAIQSESNIISVPQPPPMPSRSSPATKAGTGLSADALQGVALRKITPSEIAATRAAGQEGMQNLLEEAMAKRRGAITGTAEKATEESPLTQSASAEGDWD